jgi:hypothetical protein
MNDVAFGPSPKLVVPRRRAWLTLGLVTIVLVSAVPAAVWYVHWRSSLDSLLSYPTYGAGGVPSVIGQTEYYGAEVTSTHVISHPSNPGVLSIHISSVRPVIDENTSAATIAVMRCVLTLGGSGPLGFGQVQTDSICSTLTPFRSGNLSFGFAKGDDDVVIAVTPRHAGTVRISGVQVRYSSGFRHGNQLTGAELKVVTPG